MSAPRPRPVTARVRRPPAVGTFKSKSNLSSSSGGSTDSLISCVHETNSAGSSDGGSRDSTQDGKTMHGGTRLEMTEDMNLRCHTRDGLTSQAAPCDPHQESLGPWEKWMVQKTEQLKKLNEEKTILRQAQIRIENELEKKKQERFDKAAAIRKEWLNQKNQEQEKSERCQKLQARKLKAEAECRKVEINTKSEEKFNEWLHQKQKTESLKHELEIERNKLRELELKEKKEKSDQAFESWLKNISQRRRAKACSYATCDGMLTGYYDGGASPLPSYYNPVPWQPVHSDQSSNTTRRKGRNKRPKNPWDQQSS